MKYFNAGPSIMFVDIYVSANVETSAYPPEIIGPKYFLIL